MYVERGQKTMALSDTIKELPEEKLAVVVVGLTRHLAESTQVASDLLYDKIDP